MPVIFRSFPKHVDCAADYTHIVHSDPQTCKLMNRQGRQLLGAVRGLLRADKLYSTAISQNVAIEVTSTPSPLKQPMDDL
jgi:hypothetical protein